MFQSESALIIPIKHFIPINIISAIYYIVYGLNVRAVDDEMFERFGDHNEGRYGHQKTHQHLRKNRFTIGRNQT